MPDKSDSFKNSRQNKVLLILSVFSLLYWFTARSIQVYDNPFVGALFELLWLPMLECVFIAPAFSIIFFVRDKFNLRSLALYATILQAVALYFLFLLNEQ